MNTKIARITAAITVSATKGNASATMVGEETTVSSLDALTTALEMVSALTEYANVIQDSKETRVKLMIVRTTVQAMVYAYPVNACVSTDLSGRIVRHKNARITVLTTESAYLMACVIAIAYTKVKTAQKENANLTVAIMVYAINTLVNANVTKGFREKFVRKNFVKMTVIKMEYV